MWSGSVAARSAAPTGGVACIPRLHGPRVIHNEADGRVALYLRSDAPRLIREPDERPSGDVHERLREHLTNRGASFFRDLYYATGSGDEDTVLDALWDMVWAGEVTNDTFLPVRLRERRARTEPTP